MNAPRCTPPKTAERPEAASAPKTQPSTLRSSNLSGPSSKAPRSDRRHRRRSTSSGSTTTASGLRLSQVPVNASGERTRLLRSPREPKEPSANSGPDPRQPKVAPRGAPSACRSSMPPTIMRVRLLLGGRAGVSRAGGARLPVRERGRQALLRTGRDCATSLCWCPTPFVSAACARNCSRGSRA